MVIKKMLAFLAGLWLAMALMTQVLSPYIPNYKVEGFWMAAMIGAIISIPLWVIILILVWVSEIIGIKEKSRPLLSNFLESFITMLIIMLSVKVLEGSVWWGGLVITITAIGLIIFAHFIRGIIPAR